MNPHHAAMHNRAAIPGKWRRARKRRKTFGNFIHLGPVSHLPDPAFHLAVINKTRFPACSLASLGEIRVMDNHPLFIAKIDISNILIFPGFLDETANRIFSPHGHDQSCPRPCFQRAQKRQPLAMNEVQSRSLLSIQIAVGRDADKHQEQEHYRDN